jgi:hypothetical protein
MGYVRTFQLRLGHQKGWALTYTLPENRDGEVRIQGPTVVRPSSLRVVGWGTSGNVLIMRVGRDGEKAHIYKCRDTSKECCKEKE